MNSNAIPHVLACALTTLPLTAQNDLPEVGALAPELGLTAVLGGATDDVPTLADLRGKVVVLEFWATWCGACLQHMPEADALAEQFADEDVVFLSVTPEEPDTVARFMERRGRAGLVGIDGNEVAFSAYDPVSVPHMVLIDREGRVAASTFADQVDADVLQALLAGEEIDLPLKRTSRVDATEDATYKEPPLGPEMLVEPHEGTAGRSMRHSPWQMVAVGLPRSLILRTVYDLPRPQMRIELPGDPQWTVRAGVPEARSAELLPMLKETMARRMGYVTEVVLEEMDCTVLERIPGADAPEESEDGKGSTRTMGPNLYGKAVSMDRLARHLSNISAGQLPCVDTTGLTGRYPIELEVHDKDSLVAGLARYGLRYRKVRRELPITVFRPSDS